MRRFPFRFLELHFPAGLQDDPLLLAEVRPLGQSLLFDCGQLHHLAKRVLKSVSAIFVSHCHMDHFMGVHSFIRHNHVSPKTIDLFGPPGFIARMTAAFACYDWNLPEPYWCSFRVHEVWPERVVSVLFPGGEGFASRPLGERPRTDRVIFRNPFLQVEAAVGDHKLPVLLFRVTERPAFAVDRQRLAQRGLVGGEWLRLLKERYYGGTMAAGPLQVLRRTPEGVAGEPVADPAGLYAAICSEAKPASFGYLTDIGLTAANRAEVIGLLRGVTLLACECSFLAAERGKAERSAHLCTADLNELARELRPLFLAPLHLSKSHQGKSGELFAELALPPQTTLLRLPEHTTPRPLLLAELPKPVRSGEEG